MSSVAPWWAALGLAALVAGGAWRAGSLRADGAAAACLLGVLALRVQWAWGCYLIGWFLLASVLSRSGRAHKQRRTHGMIAKADQRDLQQVLANGGVFALCALLAVITTAAPLPAPASSAEMASADMMLLAIAAAGSLAAAGADTWATEVGTWIGGSPWSLREWRTVAPGTSGAVSLSGTLASAAGAFALAVLAAVLQMIPASAVAAVSVGGVVGATADTVLGAWMQERRWCARCLLPTEQSIHVCGSPTEHLRGIRGAGNDAVNALCSLVGGTAALTWWFLFA